MLPVVLWLGDLESCCPKAAAALELALGLALESRRSLYADFAGILSLCEEKVLESEDGRSEKRREDFPPVSPDVLVFLREKPKERRPESVLWRGAAMLSLGIGPGIEVGG